MHGILRRSLLAVLLVCLGSSCGPYKVDTQPPFNVRITNVTEGEDIRGSRSFQASAEDDSGRIAQMEFRVSGVVFCTDRTPRGSGALFACTWNPGTNPVGTYKLVATAYDATGNATDSDPVSFKIPPNQAPTSVSVKATPDTLSEGKSTTLVVEASDPDGDPLTYSWTQTPATPAGTFSGSPANPTWTWTTPPITEDQTFTLQVTVSDGKGGTAQSSVDVSVANLPDNRPPTPPIVTATPDTFSEGKSTTLTVEASDPDGDPLTYSWTQIPATPAGKFNNSSAPSPTWTAPSLTSDQSFTLQVTVSDGRGGTAQGSVEVSVANLNHLPVVDAAISAPSTVIAGATANLSINASDPDGDPLTYTWTTTPADAGIFSRETTSTPKWRSGDIANTTVVTFQVSVSDGMDSVIRKVDVQVTVPTYAQVQQVWDATCTISCHNASSASGGLNLSADSSYDALINVPGTNTACAGADRVAPGLPNASLLVQKISGTACGTRMPQGNAAYFDNNPGLLTRIRSWILAGAPSK